MYKYIFCIVACSAAWRLIWSWPLWVMYDRRCHLSKPWAAEQTSAPAPRCSFINRSCRPLVFYPLPHNLLSHALEEGRDHWEIFTRWALTRSRTPCGTRGTCCSPGRRRTGRRRSRSPTWRWAGTVYAPSGPTGRPKRRRQTSSPGTRRCLETERERKRERELFQLVVAGTAEGIKHVSHVWIVCIHSFIHALLPQNT